MAKRAPKAPEPEPPKHAGGRPSEMTPVVVEKMLEGISLGLSIVDVADLAGKARQTVYNWINAAEKAVADGTATDEQREFLDSVKSAQQEGQLRRLKRIQTGDPGWQGSAWIQERRYPRQWAATSKLGGDPDGVPIQQRIVVEYVDQPIEEDD